MDLINTIMPIIWQIIEKKRNCKANVTTFENKLIVNILFGKRKKTFCDKDHTIILAQLQQFLIA